MGRPCHAVLNLNALQHNVHRIRTCMPRQKIMAVVKANAYGHGSIAVAQTLAPYVDAFAVSCLEEALQLREQSIHQPILLLEGFFTPDELPLIVRHDLQIVLHHPEQVAYLCKAKLHQPITVWVKIDTGMHRLGFLPSVFPSVWQQLRDCQQVAQPPRVMTHLACADERDNPYSTHQFQQFRRLTESLATETSVANSAGILAWPNLQADWVRPGIMLYGVSPFADTVAAEEGLRAVMALYSELISIKTCQAGDTISYGATWRCPTAMPVGVVAAGYADGYPRHMPMGTPVLVNGQPVPLIGRVTMDMMMVDLRTQPHAQVGDPVELWGPHLPVERLAVRAGTIGYELLCNVGQRVQKITRTAPHQEGIVAL